MVSLPLAFLALVPLASVELVKAARWRVLFGTGRPPYRRCLRALVAGQLTNALSPVRAGEAVRVGVLLAAGEPAVPAAATVAGAKALDAVCLAAIATAVVGAATVAHSGWGLAAGLLVGLGALVLAMRGGPIRAWLEAQPLACRLRLPALVDLAVSLKNPRTLVGVGALTSILWLAGLGANAVVLAAVGVTPTLDLAARMLVAGYLVGFVPAPPGRLGVFEAAVSAALASGGVDVTVAVSAAVVLHVAQLAELGLLMAASLLASRWSPGSLRVDAA